jgi:hypothetical protein
VCVCAFPDTHAVNINTCIRSTTIYTHTHASQVVYEHLKNNVPDKTVAIFYAECLVLRHKSENPFFHNELIFCYVDHVSQLLYAQKEGNTKSAKAGRGEQAQAPIIDDDAKAQTVTYTLIADERGQIGNYRRKLLSFLERSAFYSADKVLSWFPREELPLLQERCVLLSRVGQHVEALSVLVHVLRSPDLAEAYCSRMSEDTKVYSTLLQVYLHPKTALYPSAEPQVEEAMRLMIKFHTFLDSPEVLNMLPGACVYVCVLPALLSAFVCMYMLICVYMHMRVVYVYM